MLFLCPRCPCGIPQWEFRSFAENGRFLNKPANMEMIFSCPRCTGAHLASQDQLFGSLAENGRFLNKPPIWKCYFPALVPIWRPKIGIWEPCRKWSISYALIWLQKRKIHGSLGKLLENGGFTGKLHDFRGFAGFQQFRHLQRKIGAWFFCYQILLTKCAI